MSDKRKVTEKREEGEKESNLIISLFSDAWDNACAVIRRREVMGEKRERERRFPPGRSTSLEYYFWYSRTVLVTYNDERVAQRERAKGACTRRAQ